MTSLRVSVSIIGIIVGIAIFLISLMAASEFSLVRGLSMSQRKFYLSSDILPDNILYPLVAGRDLLRLNLADNEEKAVLQAELAERRFQAAAELVEKGENGLALITLRKAHAYLVDILASSELAASEAQAEYWRQTIQYKVAAMEAMGSEMTVAERQTLDDIIADTQALTHLL